MYFTYVLYSNQDGKLYIGYSSNLENRFKQHCNGIVEATKYRRPLQLIYYEAYFTKEEAKRRERYLKGGNGRDQLRVQLKDTFKRFNYRFRK